MQHWTLCELVNIADEHALGLSFIDAHAMAPLAYDRRGRRDDTFEGMRRGLPYGLSVYERAWHQLAPKVCYPNSANFVQHVWTRDFSMLLCETEPATVTALDTWLPSVQGYPRCKRAKVIPGDWRDTFARGLPSPSQVGLPEGSLTLVSFDPYKYNRNQHFADLGNGLNDWQRGDLYPDDLERTLTALENVKGGIIIQISTYSTVGGNSQPDVVASVNEILVGARFNPPVEVVLDDSMMSLVYTRNVPWAEELANLHERFEGWRP